MTDEHDALVRHLRSNPNDQSISERIARLETSIPADLNQDAPLLKGVWDLRWSSSSQPWLRQAPWLENLQALDPERNKGCNLLRLRGPLGGIGAVSVQAELNLISSKRIEVKFCRGGWLGPSRPGQRQVKLMRNVQQNFPAWLDITVLSQELRICRGNAGTIFALLRRNDLLTEELLD
ncbi:MAG: PAP fibrillin [Synechococcus sp. MED-G133]|jgi:hypothetical protein|nr:PAP fibrillin [Synechococcus sp.]RZO05080.1 MAG: PAP fibrillin [Synechococcus sp. MED-G133]|tara:strand:- start:2949 stop:3482 length:534 start_codon:yes stop_codon:yes gene_type:complete